VMLLGAPHDVDDAQRLIRHCRLHRFNSSIVR
jgi:hypothetical protein